VEWEFSLPGALLSTSGPDHIHRPNPITNRGIRRRFISQQRIHHFKFEGFRTAAAVCARKDLVRRGRRQNTMEGACVRQGDYRTLRQSRDRMIKRSTHDHSNQPPPPTESHIPNQLTMRICCTGEEHIQVIDTIVNYIT
jgi:hypothetical protein